jgi:hypothetical protein
VAMRNMLLLLIAVICNVSCGGGESFEAAAAPAVITPPGIVVPVVIPPTTAPPNAKEFEATPGLYLGSSINFFDSIGRASQVLVLENQEIWSMDGFSVPAFFGQGLLSFNRTESNSSSFAVINPLSTLRSNLLEAREFSVLNINSAFGNDLLVRYDEFPADFYVKNPNAARQTRQFGGRLVNVATGFDYDKSAEIKNAVGVWGKPQALVVDINGKFDGTALIGTENCIVTGQMLPRPNGKNVFNLRVTASGCPSNGGYAGIAYVFLDTETFGGRPPYTQLTLKLMAISEDKSKVLAVTVGRS